MIHEEQQMLVAKPEDEPEELSRHRHGFLAD